jgi:hypothetical protein
MVLTSFGLAYTFLSESRHYILPLCFLDLAQPWLPKVCKRTTVVAGKLGGKFIGFWIFGYEFYLQLPELHHLTCLSP